MTDTPQQPPPTQPTTRQWRVTLADSGPRTITAHGFRVEGGALVLVQPAGCAAAYAPGTWLTIEAHDTGELQNQRRRGELR